MPAAEQKEISLVLGENAAGSAVYDYKWTMEAIANIADNAILFSITQGYMNTGTAKC